MRTICTNNSWHVTLFVVSFFWFFYSFFMIFSFYYFVELWKNLFFQAPLMRSKKIMIFVKVDRLSKARIQICSSNSKWNNLIRNGPVTLHVLIWTNFIQTLCLLTINWKSTSNLKIKKHQTKIDSFNGTWNDNIFNYRTWIWMI